MEAKTPLRMFPHDFGLSDLLQQLDDHHKCDGFLSGILNQEDLIPTECCLGEILAEDGKSSEKNKWEANEYAMKLYFISKDPTYIKQEDNLPKCHVMETRSYKRALYSYCYPQFLTPTTSPFDVDYHDKRTRRHLLSTILSPGACIKKMAQKESKLYQDKVSSKECDDMSDKLTSRKTRLKLKSQPDMEENEICDLSICDTKTKGDNFDSDQVDRKTLCKEIKRNIDKENDGFLEDKNKCKKSPCKLLVKIPFKKNTTKPV